MMIPDMLSRLSTRAGQAFVLVAVPHVWPFSPFSFSLALPVVQRSPCGAADLSLIRGEEPQISFCRKELNFHGLLGCIKAPLK